jgi:hypothetical protein
VIKSNPTPCTDWAQKLSARHPDDLSLSDRLALNEHLALCQACTKVHTAYQTMEAGIRSLLVSTPAPVLSSQRSQLAKKVAPESRISLPGLITLVLSVFSSLFIMISWSSFFQIVHTWVLTALAHFPQKVAYVSSNKHYMYAIRSGSGFILWQQKRSQQHNLVCTSPIRWSSIGYMGAGISYLSALDFCRYTASA